MGSQRLQRLVKTIRILLPCGLISPPPAASGYYPAASRSSKGSVPLLGTAPCRAGLWEGLSPCRCLPSHAAALLRAPANGAAPAGPHAPRGTARIQPPSRNATEPNQETGRSPAAGTRRAWAGTPAGCEGSFCRAAPRPGQCGSGESAAGAAEPRAAQGQG